MFRPDHRQLHDQTAGKISVVTITRDRGPQIRAALEHLLRLPERPPVIVVDNSSSDETVHLARDASSVIDIVPLDRNLGGAGRNVGVSRAETPYVAFSDDDSCWAPGALACASDLLDAHPSLGLNAARVLAGRPERVARSRFSGDGGQSNFLERQGGTLPVDVPVVGFLACGAVVRRTAFLQAGGFEPLFGVGGEEQVLALDLLPRGWQLAYVDEVLVHHHHSPIRDEAERPRREVRNALWTAWLRRPSRSALAVTWRTGVSSLRDPVRRAGLADAILGLTWVLSARHPIPATIERQVKIAEEAFYT